MSVVVSREGPITLVTIDRPARRNAVDRATADALVDAFLAFDADADARVAILSGSGGHFCAGADLKAFAAGDGNRLEAIDDQAPWHPQLDNAPMGPTRLRLHKPVIAAIAGHAVAGGLELAIWCDLRVVERSAVMGVFCRRFGVPLIDGGTVRLPRLIGESRAMDLILTGRAVAADEALAMGLANRLVDDGGALDAARALATQIAAAPQRCMRSDRQSVLGQWGLGEGDALAQEMAHGLETIASGETLDGAAAFSGGAGRGGSQR